MKTLNEFAAEVHQNAIEHGWWDEERSFGDIIALCHSELSEALEEYRAGNKIRASQPTPMLYYSGGGYVANAPTKICTKPEGMAVEMADCIIRILDWCGKEGIDIEAVLDAKHAYNKTRPYRHGGKAL
jgi:NTP pyrophosphatase (non-canonical NTP hydrolase)